MTTLTRLILAVAATAATAAHALTPTDSARIARVFPFEVGQRYQFKSGGDFRRPNGDVLPAGQVAEITIRDTVIEGQTYLRIPYWSPFGWDSFRMGSLPEDLFPTTDSLWVLGAPPAGLPLHLSVGLYPQVAKGCDDCPGLTPPAPFSYRDAIEERIVRCYYLDCPRTLWGWLETGADSVFRVKYFYSNSDDENWGVDFRFGEYGPGSATHGSQTESPDQRHVWAVFRPRSDDPWPELHSIVGPVGVEHPGYGAVSRPLRRVLSAFPNPFNPTVTVRYSIPTSGEISVRVYDITGRVVRTLVTRHAQAGAHTVTWDGADDAGRAAGSGVYILRLMIERNPRSGELHSNSSTNRREATVRRVLLLR